MKLHPRLDANHNDIVKALRKAGALVFSLAPLGDGIPDLLVGHRGQTILLEVKDGAKPPSARALTADEKAWHSAWRGRGGLLVVVNSVEEALEVLSPYFRPDARAPVHKAE